jgi:hypothetical protein
MAWCMSRASPPRSSRTRFRLHPPAAGGCHLGQPPGAGPHCRRGLRAMNRFDRREFGLATWRWPPAPACRPQPRRRRRPQPRRRGPRPCAAALSRWRSARPPAHGQHQQCAPPRSLLVDLSTRAAYNHLTWVNENLEWQSRPPARSPPPTTRLPTSGRTSPREGVRFHNGKEMTTEDVVASYNHHRQKAAFARQIQKVEALSQIQGALPPQGRQRRVPVRAGRVPARHDAGLHTPGRDRAVTASAPGPFSFAVRRPQPLGDLRARHATGARASRTWTGSRSTTAKASRRRHCERPARAAVRRRADHRRRARCASLQREPDLDRVRAAAAAYHCVIQLPKHPGSPFEDKRIRQALALAIDREAIVRTRPMAASTGWVGNDSHLVSTDPRFLSRPDQARRGRCTPGPCWPRLDPNGIALPTLLLQPAVARGGHVLPGCCGRR